MVESSMREKDEFGHSRGSPMKAEPESGSLLEGGADGAQPQDTTGACLSNAGALLFLLLILAAPLRPLAG